MRAGEIVGALRRAPAIIAAWQPAHQHLVFMTSVLKSSLFGMVCCGGMLLFAAGAPAQDTAEKKPEPPR